MLENQPRRSQPLALAGSRSFLKTLRARITSAQHKRIDEVLEIIGLTGQREAPGRILAHGQKQWLEIGMLLMQNPELLLEDEPVAGMTPHEIERTADLRLPGASRCCTKVRSLRRETWRKCRRTLASSRSILECERADSQSPQPILRR